MEHYSCIRLPKWGRTEPYIYSLQLYLHFCIIYGSVTFCGRPEDASGGNTMCIRTDLSWNICQVFPGTWLCQDTHVIFSNDLPKVRGWLWEELCHRNESDAACCHFSKEYSSMCIFGSGICSLQFRKDFAHRVRIFINELLKMGHGNAVGKRGENTKNFENIPKNLILLLIFKKYLPTNIHISPHLPVANRRA